ncbi:MAG: hypothetical protein R2695_19970 [Acidimicrobiales bacterium]
MDNDIKPSSIMLMAGGAVLFLSTLLKWAASSEFFDGYNGWKTSTFGLHGIFVALIGLAIGGGVALTQFTETKLPERILSFNHDQIHFALGLAAFLITFGYQFNDFDKGIGILLAWIASAVIIAGAVMDMRADAEPAAPPTQF